jgi:hypothetical protein
MHKREPRDTILYARIKQRNETFIEEEMKRLGYKSKSEFMDDLFDDLRNKKAPLDRNPK